MVTCPAPPALQPGIDSPLATKPRVSNTALITYFSIDAVLFAPHPHKPEAIKSTYTSNTPHNLEEPILSRNQWERSIHSQHQATLQYPTTTPEATSNYTIGIILVIIILLNMLQQRSVIRAFQKLIAMLMLWIRRLNPHAAQRVQVVYHTKLVRENGGMEEEKFKPAKLYAADFGAIVVPNESVGAVGTDPIPPPELDEPLSAITEDFLVTSQVAEGSQLSNISDGEISSPDVCGERIDISTCSTVNIESCMHSPKISFEEEREMPKDQHLLSPIPPNLPESDKSATASSISDEENRPTAVCCVPSVSEKKEKCELESEKDVPQDTIEHQDDDLKIDNEHAVQGKNERSMLLLQSIAPEVEHANGEEHHHGGEASQLLAAKDEPPRVKDVCPPLTAGAILPSAEDTISLLCSRGLNDEGNAGDSTEAKTLPVTPIDMKSM
ncbi:hypothetical protein P167DRAFT_577476 [Morchella conica CCBAS932]|uniref:Uncharacterized protein n=1 Tax=Morchella conica CCBAS932 TaxID=1392247 RepID=A0A3N4KIJ9_9PEZI|nr:hypothetical protein P167DRAFT_577476 [Morchella conica CCBAS932]